MESKNDCDAKLRTKRSKIVEEVRLKYCKDGDMPDKSTKFGTDATQGLRIGFLIGPTSVDNIMTVKRGGKGVKNALYKLTI